MNSVVFRSEDRAFSNAINARVNAYFEQNKLTKTGSIELFIKTGLFIPLAIFVYGVLLFGPFSGIIQILLWLSLGVLMSLIAINIMHDANHGSFAKQKWINALMSLTMNAIGSNAFLWRTRHNHHHTFTNVSGVDCDIDNMPLLRQSPKQEWKPLHRYQYLYMFPLYTIGTLHWFLISDFIIYFTRRIADSRIKAISLKDHILFWASKLVCLFIYILLPLFVLGWQQMLFGFLIVHFTMGFSLILLVQLAHVMDNTHFESAEEGTNEINTEWAIHEVRTTTNFATKNRILNWLAGGLNFQIEHHLFPRVSHVHYPALSKIIKAECERFGITYNHFPTMSAAVMSHIRFMKHLGTEKSAPPQT